MSSVKRLLSKSGVSLLVCLPPGFFSLCITADTQCVVTNLPVHEQSWICANSTEQQLQQTTQIQKVALIGVCNDTDTAFLSVPPLLTVAHQQ
jgi:hypothetical protein